MLVLNANARTSPLGELGFIEKQASDLVLFGPTLKSVASCSRVHRPLVAEWPGVSLALLQLRSCDSDVCPIRSVGPGAVVAGIDVRVLDTSRFVYIPEHLL